ncbi:hypothetical protein ABMA28_006313 [Loxostege sticticalis]|uniref:Farnesyl diphosphate synthase n=1 Tax=Loxostege sticticalis TaxID=481309 RepID=A0ABD0SN50_LOXSC
MLTSYSMIENPDNVTAETFHKASVLAWAAQMVDSCNQVLRNERNGHVAGLEQNFAVSDSIVEDADLLRSFIYAMIEQNFQDTKWFRDFIQLYNKAFLYSAIGRYLELSFQKHSNTYANINANEYEKLCDYKVSYPFFELPLSLAMTLANKSNTGLESVGKICKGLGLLYKIQEDFKNCFGDEAMIGTGGTDIQKGKCTWLAVTALQRLTPRQRVVFEACYGSEEPAHIERVKLLYEQIQLPRLYRERSGALYESIMQQAETLEESGIPSKLFEECLEAIITE